MEKVKYMTICAYLSNISLLIEVIIIELTDLKLSDIYPFVVLSLAILVFVISLFFYEYFHNRKAVEKLQEDYLKSLKPKIPLRFCASDTELMEKYNKAKEQKDASILLSVIAKGEKEDEEEREM